MGLEANEVSVYTLGHKGDALWPGLVKTAMNLYELSGFSGDAHKSYIKHLETILPGSSDKNACTAIVKYQKQLLDSYTKKVENNLNDLISRVGLLVTTLLDTCFDPPSIPSIIWNQAGNIIEGPCMLMDDIIKLLDKIDSQEEKNKFYDAVSPLFGQEETRFLFTFIVNYKNGEVTTNSKVANGILTYKINDTLTDERAQFLTKTMEVVELRLSQQLEEAKDLFDSKAISFKDQVNKLVKIDAFQARIKMTRVSLNGHSWLNDYSHSLDNQAVELKNSINKQLEWIENISGIDLLKSSKDDYEEVIAGLNDRDVWIKVPLIEAYGKICDKLSLLDIGTVEQEIKQYEQKLVSIGDELKKISLKEEDLQNDYSIETNIQYEDEKLKCLEKHECLVKDIESRQLFSFSTLSWRYPEGWFPTTSWLGVTISWHDPSEMNENKLKEVALALGLVEEITNNNQKSYSYDYDTCNGAVDCAAPPYQTVDEFIQGYNKARQAYNAGLRGDLSENDKKTSEILLMQHASQTESAVQYQLAKKSSIVEKIKKQKELLKKIEEGYSDYYTKELEYRKQRQKNLLTDQEVIQEKLTQSRQRRDQLNEQVSARKQYSEIINKHQSACQMAIAEFENRINTNLVGDSAIIEGIRSDLMTIVKEHFNRLSNSQCSVICDTYLKLETVKKDLQKDINIELKSVKTALKNCIQKACYQPDVLIHPYLLARLWNRLLDLLKEIACKVGIVKKTDTTHKENLTDGSASSLFFHALNKVIIRTPSQNKISPMVGVVEETNIIFN